MSLSRCLDLEVGRVDALNFLWFLAVFRTVIIVDRITVLSIFDNVGY
jgi:predicted GNAT superfamily acetyltransferase